MRMLNQKAQQKEKSLANRQAEQFAQMSGGGGGSSGGARSPPSVNPMRAPSGPDGLI